MILASKGALKAALAAPMKGLARANLGDRQADGKGRVLETNGATTSKIAKAGLMQSGLHGMRGAASRSQSLQDHDRAVPARQARGFRCTFSPSSDPRGHRRIHTGAASTLSVRSPNVSNVSNVDSFCDEAHNIK